MAATPSLSPPRPRLRGALPWSGLAVAVAYALGRAWSWRDAVMDDAFIGYRCAANFLAGRGLSFNPGERVEAITNLGWVLLTTIGGAGAIPAVAKVAGLLLAVATLVLLTLAARRLARPAERTAIVAPLPLFLAASPDFLYFSVAGMETGLAAALVAAALAHAAAAPTAGPARGRALALGVVGGLLFAVRPESAPILPLAGAALLVLDRPAAADRGRGAAAGRRRDLLAAATVFALAVVAVTLFRWTYFGSPLPTSFFAKRADLARAVVQGFASLDAALPNLPPPFAGLLHPLAGGWGLMAIRRRSPLAAAVAGAAAATGVLFALYAAPDWTGTGRYFAPYLPAAWLLLWWGLVAAAHRSARAWAGRRPGRAPDRRPIAATAAVAVLAALLVGAGLFRTQRLLGWDAAHAYPGYVTTGHTLVAPSRWIGAHLPAGATLATRRIGAVGYHSRLKVFDYAWGLTDPAVARRVGARGDGFDDPRHPALAEAWRRAAPDYLLEDESRLDGWLAPGGESLEGGFTVHGLRYRLARRFPIGDGTEFWALCERIDRPGPASAAGSAPSPGDPTEPAGAEPPSPSRP
jgi:hypothetical protein